MFISAAPISKDMAYEDRSEASIRALDAAAVWLGSHDPLSSIAGRSGRPSLLGWLWGPGGANELANPRLEALRHLVVGLRHDRQVPRRLAIAEALEAGIDAELITRLCARFQPGSAQ